MADLTVSDAEELELIRQHRERKAAAERLADAWTQVFAELSEVAEKDLGAWRAAGLKFIERAKAAGWDEGDEIDDFVTGLLNATGWREAHVRNHGYVWKRVRRGAAEEGADE
jgi:hypothetical protein